MNGNEDSTNPLPEPLVEMMNSPQIAQILSSLGKTAENAPGKEEGKEQNSFELPPDFAEKLPAVMSALAGMGIGEKTQSPAKPASQNHTNSKRNALLRAVKPYLSPRRQSIIDGMLKLESLTGLFQAADIFKDGGTK